MPRAMLAGGLVVLACFGCNRPVSGAIMATSEVPVTRSDSAMAIPDLVTLTRSSSLVVVGRVAGSGRTQVVQQPPQTPVPFNGPTPQAAPQPRAPQPSGSTSVTLTAVPVVVERVARGTAAIGSQITVLQNGAVFAAPGQPTRTLNVEGDAPLAMGDRLVLFLSRNPDGTFAIVGDQQGRLTIDAQEHVHPVQPGQALRGRDGTALDEFLRDVENVK